YPVAYYADQKSDSLEIYTTDSWETNTNCNWMVFKETASAIASGEVKYVYGIEYLFTRCMWFGANTTGSDRETVVTAKANKKQVSLVVRQCYHLNVTNPQKAASGLVNSEYDFSKTLNANETSSPLAFTLYADATLKTETPWIGVSNETFKAGDNSTEITLQTNNTGEKRTGKVTLKSETGASTDIYIIQKAS
ncbi:MAG: hypothetical protein ACI4TR_04945, partial [Bacteroidaceae bacterium]